MIHGGAASRISTNLGIDSVLIKMILDFTDTLGSGSWTPISRVEIYHLLSTAK